MAAQTGDLSQRFKRFADLECHISSPLYEKISLGVSKDDELLELASSSSHGPIPNLFLAAVHYLLLKGNGKALSRSYPDIAAKFDGESDPMPLFRDFCLKNRESVRDILRTRLVQTNEVQRSALLMPAFQFVSSRARTPLALVEIGAAAGLNLLWDRYVYGYGDGSTYGDEDSGLRLECELRGRFSPPMKKELPEVSFRVGIDLNPLDVNNEDDMLWSKALIWPEHWNRMRLLESAIKTARGHRLKLLRGDALELIPTVLEETPKGSAICLVSTFTLNQFSPESRERLGAILAKESKDRDLWLVYVEYPSREAVSPELHAVLRRGDQHEDFFLARCEPHGEWLEWMEP